MAGLLLSYTGMSTSAFCICTAQGKRYHM
uniref:Uncharacterized protein n=1 Tax=Anguilla anguilla TaxID=7936 RepID=A0A0E9PH19_ANGAN